MSEFHFLRPEWLVALPLALVVAWLLLGGRRGRNGWHAVVDTALQPFVLVRAGASRGRRLPLVLAALAAVLGVLALAGPTWERVPVPAFRSDEALVVAIDLSRSMDAGDLEPSRLARAKLKLLSLLERRTSGQTGLVVFTAHAFTVTPLTTDTRTVGALVNALTSDIMPSRGSYIEAGLAKAAALLSQAGATRGDVLVMTDAEVSRASLDLAAELRGEGYTVHVLAAGTEDGAPIPEATGGFLTDRSGQVVIPRVDLEALARLADVGGGRFAQMTADDRDLARLFPAGDAGEVVDAGAEEYAADVWRDQGVWLVLALLPLAALAFRRGWVYVALVVLALPAERARAFEWRDLWERPDQQGIEAIESGDPARASDLFDDPRWRAAAQYRAGEFAASAASLAPLSTVTDFYNTGNALAKSGQLEAAIGAYDRALELDPSHDDARYNRELVEDLLEQQQQQQQQQNEQQQNEESGESGESQDQASSSDQSSESQGEQSESDDERQSTADSEQRDPGDEERDGDEQQDETGEPPDEPRQVAAASPEDIEEWADEQAAEQWLRRIPQDPGGLLRRKFLYQYQRLGRDQEGNYVWPGDEAKPW